MNSATTWTWVWWTGAALIGALGLWLALRGLLHDPGRRMRRCPRCWYGMAGVAGTLCPECGRDAGDERRLVRRRRRWRKFALGLTIGAFSGFLFVLPSLSARRVVSLMPWTVAIALWPDGLTEGSAIDEEIERVIGTRLRTDTLWGWQRRMLARRSGEAAKAEISRLVAARAATPIPLATIDPLWQDDLDPYALLVRLGPEREAAVPALVRAARAGSLPAIEALRAMGPIAHAAGPDLIAIVRSTPPIAAAPDARVTLPGGPGATATAAGAPIDLSGSVADAALAALAAVDTETPAALDLFRELAASDALALPLAAVERFADDAAIRETVLAAATKELAAALARGSGAGARANDPRRVGVAVEALHSLGPRAAPAAALLGRFAEGSGGSTRRWRALDALAAIGPDAAAALPSIEPILASDDSRDRLWACYALAAIGADPAAVGEILGAVHAPAVSRQVWDEQLLAIDMLGRLPLRNEAIVPALAGACDDDWTLMGTAAPAAIGRRAGIDAAAAPALVRLLSDPRPLVRIAAARALGAAGADARPALGALREAAHDEDARVASAAARAIEAIRLARPQR